MLNIKGKYDILYTQRVKEYTAWKKELQESEGMKMPDYAFRLVSYRIKMYNFTEKEDVNEE